jgi:hypothetical protein
VGFVIFVVAALDVPILDVALVAAVALVAPTLADIIGVDVLLTSVAPFGGGFTKDLISQFG